MHGGGHERGMRSGTLPTHQCVGMGEAFAIAQAEMGVEASASACCSSACSGIGGIEQVFINGDLERGCRTTSTPRSTTSRASR
jgi:cysteine desulfurase